MKGLEGPGSKALNASGFVSMPSSPRGRKMDRAADRR
jgi:hypothetical protein